MRCSTPATAAALRIGGIVPLSTVDFPGELAAVIFCQGCPWNCLYCQNSHLVPARGEAIHCWQDLERFLHARRGLLDAVVFSGGEPTTQSALAAAMTRIRSLGFKVGLHTAGACPRRFAAVLGSCDWIGLDIKALPEQYETLTTVPRSGHAAWDCLPLLIESGIGHEVRTTLHSQLSSLDSLMQLGDRLCASGVRNWALQVCNTSQGNARGLPANRWPDDEFLRLIEQRLQPKFENLVLR